MLSAFQTEMVDALLRYGVNGNYVNGEWLEPFGFGLSVKIIVPQPLKENDLQMIPNGEWGQDWRVTWIQRETKIRRGPTSSDYIQYDGINYKVVQVDDRHVLGNFYRVVMRKADYEE